MTDLFDGHTSEVNAGNPLLDVNCSSDSSNMEDLGLFKVLPHWNVDALDLEQSSNRSLSGGDRRSPHDLDSELYDRDSLSPADTGYGDTSFSNGVGDILFLHNDAIQFPHTIITMLLEQIQKITKFENIYV